MIHSFSCKNFRNININNMSFKRINLLIGPNNSGKSNFIKAITFYSNVLKHGKEGGLNTAFLNAIKRNGWKHIRNKRAEDDAAIELSWNLDLKNTRVDYMFSFITGEKPEDCRIVKECMDAADKRSYAIPFNYFSCHDRDLGKGYISTAVSIGDRNNTRKYFNVDSSEIFCSQYKDIILSDPEIYSDDKREELVTLLESLEKSFLDIRAYSSSRINTDAMRRSLEMDAKEDTLLPDASNFSAVFNRYKNDALRWKRLFLEKMQELDDKIVDLDVVTKYDKFDLYIDFQDDLSMDMTDVSEGTLKALVLNMLLNLPPHRENFLLAFDEPENNLHPAWQKIVGRWVQESGSFEQCFISTHSPDFLDAFTEKYKMGEVGVFVFDGMGNIREVEYKLIKDDLENWELGDLYRVNDPALGGWPW